MLERLSQNVERKFWKGSDIETATDLILNRVARVPFIIHPDNLPSIDRLSPEDFHFLHGSVRSRYAQLGLDLDENVGLGVADAIIKHKGAHEPFYVDVLLLNRSSRSIHVPKGARIFRLYYDVKESALFGRDLIHAFTSGNIKIEGEFGRDWVWAYGGEDSRGDENIVGVHVRIDSRGRRWIPPDANNIAVTVDDSMPDYRTKIDEFLVPIPHTRERILWVGQTNKITLSAVEVVLNKETRSSIDVSARRLTRGYQVSSRLIDDGRTNWPVRVEILSPTTRSTISNFVTFHVRRNLHK